METTFPFWVFNQSYILYNLAILNNNGPYRIMGVLCDIVKYILGNKTILYKKR